MLQGKYSAILSTFIKLPFVIKILVLSIFEWLFYTGFTVQVFTATFNFNMYYKNKIESTTHLESSCILYDKRAHKNTSKAKKIV